MPDLGGRGRTFAVANGAAADDLLIAAILHDGGLKKTGAGRLLLAGSNTQDGGRVIAEGVLTLTTPMALGVAMATPVVGNGAGLELRSLPKPVFQTLILYGDGRGWGALVAVTSSNTWSGPIQMGCAPSLVVAPRAALRLEGILNATGQTLRSMPGATVNSTGPSWATPTRPWSRAVRVHGSWADPIPTLSQGPHGSKKAACN
ncbi:MAG: hypothetical protein RMN51_12680 [Verrucomicrobiota bacterium]|nr:hypothetical protein [Limisphaera sp.]MDW8382949.1 hypothetical protein [Verrucomicrobiota bacterium]